MSSQKFSNVSDIDFIVCLYFDFNFIFRFTFFFLCHFKVLLILLFLQFFQNIF